MKLSELSELHLAAVVAGATFLGGIGSSLVSVFLVDAGTERQTDVQLVQLAVGILSEPLPEDAVGPAETSETPLREWAVDTINAAAEVKFDERARALLISGDARFGHLTGASSGDPEGLEEILEIIEDFNENIRRESEAPQPRGEPSPP